MDLDVLWCFHGNHGQKFHSNSNLSLIEIMLVIETGSLQDKQVSIHNYRTHDILNICSG